MIIDVVAACRIMDSKSGYPDGFTKRDQWGVQYLIITVPATYEVHHVLV